MTIRPTRYGQSYPPLDVCRVSPARCPVRVANRRIALGPPPSLHHHHHLRRRAISGPALFGSFSGTTQQSDFPAPWLIGVRPKASRRALHSMLQKTLGPPGSRTKCLRACAGSLTARGPPLPRQCCSDGVAFGLLLQPRHPEPPTPCGAGHVFRGSIPGPHVPLSTLRPHPYECARMTQGRRSWLSFQRMKLSFTTLCRF